MLLYCDGLSCERVDGAQKARINGGDQWSRLEMFEPGLTDSGLGAQHFSKLVTTMGIPWITTKTIKRTERETKIPMYDVAKDSCLRVIEEDIECTRSGRKRPRKQNIDNSRNWPKETYLEKLKEMGIGVNATWKVEMLRQLYLANKSKTPSITIPETSNQPPVNELQNSTNSNLNDQEVGLYHPSTLPVVNDTRIHTPGNTPNFNSEVLFRESAAAFTSATETLSNIAKLMLKTSSTENVTEKEATTLTLESAIRSSKSRQTDSASEATSTEKCTTSRDLPKKDFVAPSIKKQIIEGRDIDLAELLAPKYDILQ
ncbi:Hypothetical predicted protein [Mytilus galloprovincialis]|uniref:Uncharacterized protein n=1 Tax=Mytilus galloprovincialis TaxID=29158 RepID=A0A8B6E2F0_MYTGA|nr:Hypothetical predicted protein [Mytilus galloprovincialis]